MGGGGKLRLSQKGWFNVAVVELVGKRGAKMLPLYLKLFLSGGAVVTVKQNEVKHIVNRHAALFYAQLPIAPIKQVVLHP